jgi:hypothetical protein
MVFSLIADFHSSKDVQFGLSGTAAPFYVWEWNWNGFWCGYQCGQAKILLSQTTYFHILRVGLRFFGPPLQSTGFSWCQDSNGCATFHGTTCRCDLPSCEQFETNSARREFAPIELADDLLLPSRGPSPFPGWGLFTNDGDTKHQCDAWFSLQSVSNFWAPSTWPAPLTSCPKIKLANQ